MSIEKEESYFSDNDSRLERKVSRFLRLLLYIGIVCCFCMVFLTVRHTIGRYGFNSPTPGNAELTTLCMLVLVMLVIAFTQMRHGHIEIGMIVERFNPRVRLVVQAIIEVLVLLFLGWATVRTGIQAVEQITLGNVSNVLYIPNYPFLFLVTFGWATVIVAVLIQLIHTVRSLVRGVRA